MKFQSTNKDRVSIDLTVYQKGFGTVKDVRRIASDKEISEVHFLDIADQIESETILVKGFKELERNYENGFINTDQLLEKYIGQVATLRNEKFRDDLQIRLLSTSGGVVGERVDTKEIIVNPLGQLILPPLPENLTVRPALILKVVPQTFKGDVRLSYLTQGIEWKVTYIAEIQGTALHLAGLMQLRNQSGTDFFDTAIKLIAGQINHSSAGIGRPYEMELFKSSASSPEFSGQPFADHHVYKLERKVDLLHGQTKQIQLLEAQVVSFRKVYEVSNSNEQVRIKIEFDNVEANGLGIPLPAGTVKIFEQDTDSELEFTGEDQVSHTAKDGKLSISIGEAFDITCKSREKKRELKDGIEYVTHRYDLKNGKEENVRIHICHSIYDPVWQMETSSHDYQIKSSNEVEFIIRVVSGKSAAVDFTYQIDRH
ncbi:DUF4139 domain-containing protein [Planococcus shixiaomingii]|uniref:DUF4139 domain-containing protein n=1 Tax=Planococcus shixiaomingii TaxID=3058393 RepID=UPI0026399180|nr:DUF4139 domain-containing protein [Planococcus sp. N022]WKA55096.1 DUF4139 domain-containing protein [Planococcus sp. N022]